jgi:hypothetical protein
MQVIMIIRLYAMYQQSKKMLVFLCVIFLVVEITSVIMLVVRNIGVSGGELSS